MIFFVEGFNVQRNNVTLTLLYAPIVYQGYKSKFFRNKQPCSFHFHSCEQGWGVVAKANTHNFDFIK
jgi:hypothetical protein